MAVTKFHPIEAVEEALGAGISLFGESRVQEAEAKFAGFLALHPEARLEMIGKLQTNKAKKALALFDCVQSVDSLDLLHELNKRALAAGPSLDLLLELHTGEESKAGFPNIDELLRAAELIKAFSETKGCGLELRGLMTIAPFTEDESLVRRSFRCLKKAFDEVDRHFDFPRFDVLSMGMTNDFEIAIEEGSNLIRIGTGLFGSRTAEE